jgi:hypothetical protein
MRAIRHFFHRFAIISILVSFGTTVGIYSSDAVESQLPTTEQFNGMLSTCAVGLNAEISSDLIGSVTSIYSGQRTNGVASFKSVTDFLKMFPEGDRAKVYELYTRCISVILSRDIAAPPAHPSPPPSKSPSRNSSLRFGFDVPCENIEPSANVQTILRKFGDEALISAPATRIVRTERPVIVRPSVGGDDHQGAISPNSRVRVICMMDANFAVIKQEQGNRGGVVDVSDLEMP